MLRLTGGVFRGRTLATPTSYRTRPTQSKLRQALFNSLQTTIPEAKVLDLFAGSGALGFEALSRGADSVVFVESSRQVGKLIEQNAKALGVENQVSVIVDSVASAVKKLGRFAPFDLVVADPPYAEGWATRLLTDCPWDELLVPEGYFCLEWGTTQSQESELPNEVPFLNKIREKNYGDSVLTTYQSCL